MSGVRAAAHPAHVDLERGQEAGEAVGAVLDRDHHRDLGRRRHSVGRLGDGVRDPGVEQAAGQRGGGRVGDGEPPADQPGGRGGRQVQHPRRRPAQQYRAVVEDAGAPFQSDRRPLHDSGAVGSSAHPGTVGAAAPARRPRLPTRPARRSLTPTASRHSGHGESSHRHGSCATSALRSTGDQTRRAAEGRLRRWTDPSCPSTGAARLPRCCPPRSPRWVDRPDRRAS